MVISLLGPLGSGVDVFSKLVLTGLHLGAGATMIPLMRRTATSDRGRAANTRPGV